MASSGVPVNRIAISSSAKRVAAVATVAHVPIIHRSRSRAIDSARAEVSVSARSGGSGLRSSRSTKPYTGVMMRPIHAVRFSEATMTATAKTPTPTRTAMTTTVRSVPSIGVPDTSSPIAATTGSTSLMPMLNTLPAATASVASVGE